MPPSSPKVFTPIRKRPETPKTTPIASCQSMPLSWLNLDALSVLSDNEMPPLLWHLSLHGFLFSEATEAVPESFERRARLNGLLGKSIFQLP